MCDFLGKLSTILRIRMSSMKDKKVVPFCPKPVPLKDRSQEEIIHERRKKRDAMLNKLRRKEK